MTVALDVADELGVARGHPSKVAEGLRGSLAPVLALINLARVGVELDVLPIDEVLRHRKLFLLPLVELAK